jgi:hypothetical protein
MSKNKLRTPSYFIKRLRDNGFIVVKLFAIYSKSDPRQWTVMVNPTEASVLITCYANKNNIDEILFEIDDGGKRVPKNFFIKTSSIEVIIDYLLGHGVSNNTDYPGRDRYLSKRLNTYDEKQRQV